MAGKLGLTDEVKEMKLGKSFGKGEHPCFHTFRYDFMPASLDTTKRATVDIGDGHQVTVTVPHIEGSGTDNTVFKGSKKPYQKECVLIIDHATGEITLEKLSYNVQLKKTRAEGSSKIRSNTPIENTFNSKKSPQPSSHKLSPQQKSHSAFGRSSSPIQKSSPMPKSPVSNQLSPNGSSNHSMPCLNSLTKPPVIPETSAVNPSQEDNHGGEIGVLSSSSSSASSSSGDSSDSSASDNEEMVEVPHKSQDVSNGFNESPRRKEPSSQTSSNHLSMPTSNNLSMPTSNNFSMPTSNNFSMPSSNNFSMPSSNNFSMPSSNNFSMPTSNNLSMPTSNNLSMPTANSLPSMPKFNLLNDDLKLSESDSEDSDD